MLDSETKRHIDNARDVLVGKVPDPKAQIEMITIALIYKFMDDMDKAAVEMGGKPSFFTGQYKEYTWTKLMDIKMSGIQRVKLYSEALEKMPTNRNLPQLFRDILKDAFLSFRDPETLNLFLKEIAWFDYEHSENLGNAFEYLLSIMSSQGDAGQFRTPRHIIDFMVDVISPEKNETILDPACGTAGFLISAYNHILNKNTKKNKGDKLTPEDRKKIAANIVGYDISPDMVRLSRVNLYLHGFTTPKIYEYDTLTSEERWNDNFDVILANPPFMTPKGGIRPHKKFAIQANRSEVLFVDYIAEHINLKGRAAVIVPEGIIFQSANAYKALRKKLVDENYLWAVVSLPAGIFNPYAGVKTSILFMDREIAKKVKNVLFVKVSNDGFNLGAQRREIAQNDLPIAAEAMKTYAETIEKELALSRGVKKSGICEIVPKSKLAENEEFNLSADRYIIEEVRINQKWQLTKLENLCEFSNGLWKSEKEPLKTVKILRNTNFTKNGFLKLDDIAELPVEIRLFEKKKMEFGDILLEKSGGGPTQPVGRVVYFDIKEGEYSFSNFTSRIRVLNNKKIESKFLWLVLNNLYLNGKTEKLQKQTSGIRNLDFDMYKSMLIPLPPLEIQRAIIAEIDSYQKIIDGARMVVDNWKPRIDIDPKWPMVKLKEICGVSMGQSPEGESYNTTGKGVPLINGPVEFGPESFSKTIKSKFTTNPTKMCKEGDLILCVRGSTTGRMNIAGFDACIGRGVAALRAKDNQTWINIYIDSIRNRIYSLGSGSTFPNVTTSTLMDLEIPNPPIQDKLRIVNQIEAERKSVDSCKGILKLYEDKIKQVIDKVWR